MNNNLNERIDEMLKNIMSNKSAKITIDGRDIEVNDIDSLMDIKIDGKQLPVTSVRGVIQSYLEAMSKIRWHKAN